MGCLFSQQEPEIVIHVWTGDRRNAGTDANVYVILHEEQGYSSRAIKLHHYARNDHQRGDLDSFHIARDSLGHLQRLAKISRLELWKDDSWACSDWFVDRIEVENRVTGDSFMFPIFRWIKAHYHYQIKHLDTSLPQFEEYPDQRKMELQEKRAAYQFDQKVPGGPAQLKSIPMEEQFSFENEWNLHTKRADLVASGEYTRFAKKHEDEFDTIHSIEKLFGSSLFPKPSGVDRWKNDIYFGLQRLSGLNHSLIRCVSALPDKLPVSDSLLQPLLDDLPIAHALATKSLFICDLELLDGIPARDGFVLCAPIAMFYLDQSRNLRPVAIQLFQTPGPDNPIFTPHCDEMTWNLAKLWFNNADAAYHQAIARLGTTHFLMEGITVATHRNLSQSHPIFKLLAPHFLYLLSINAKGLDYLIEDGGFLDTCTNIGRNGLFALIEKCLGQWRMDENGTLTHDLANRGLDDPDVLPCYYFREDATLLLDTISKYVTSYVALYYPTDALLQGDEEIQAWAAELVKEKNGSEGGVGILGVPGNGRLETRQQLEQIVASTVYTCSVFHSSTNFPQYEEYAFPPNYPALLRGRPPTDLAAVTTEEDVVKCLPDRQTTLEIMTVTKLLSQTETSTLGEFDVQFVFDPRAVEVQEEFQADLQVAGEKIKERNLLRDLPYPYLVPEVVPSTLSV